ncbi:cytochrome c-type biogenesis protein CcmH/formate-dependent nitrite reductase complex subunit NrfG [Pasteurella langaaensis DSM 22999]|uniref:Cytochrome c-type biogenesis protein CcmH/formate-dependent nitrite reductase complex subunit NrfG n=1 Tax=Alitibacter langaaensis DSM 22999 TaxID=1122935 RepID=A0A2U0TGK4_9PAST|nr:c-type cytochrome biogenesis protein [Pasteurella langaaensis]PVX42746.1 cytochrome c-type biogenesis protein CcmH/formate-dependent nitrite reductase complex subunit NrfG [Pasteurella langaaensis DSM 22999]
MILTVGIVIFALIILLIFVPFAQQIDWHKNLRQQQNIALYQQQMAQQPAPELADEFSQRLLDDEQSLQNNQSPLQQTKSAVKFSPVFLIGLYFLLICLPLAYYFSLHRFDFVQQGREAFAEKRQQIQTATATEKNDDYILSMQNTLRRDPNNAEAWLELGQAYAFNNEFDHALVAYSNAEKISGSKPAILGLAATALYYQAGQRITPKAQQLIDAALAEDAYETSSLSLLASDAFLKRDYANALKYWQKLLDSERQEVNRRQTIESMEMARSLLNNQP